MDLLVVRHAIAEDREAFAEAGGDDASRPLTRGGRRKFERAVRGLRRVVESIDLVATSPLVRAVETGAVLQQAFRVGRPVRLRALAPDADPAAAVAWLRRQDPEAVVAVVGHEPHLSGLVAYLLSGRRAGFIDLRKGGACLLTLATATRPGGGVLRWLLAPGQLRRLGG